MMKKLFVICLGLLLLACNSENANDCFQNAGAIKTQEVAVEAFTKLRANRNTTVVIKQGNEQKVIIETGENLMNDVLLKVVDGQLIIDNNNTCNFVRDYDLTKIYVTTTNLDEIICSTQFKVSSDGVLNFPNVKLSSESFNDPAVITVGRVELSLNSQAIQIIGNNLTQFKISGTTNTLDVGVYSGDGTVDASSLTANKVSIFHRGSNDISVNPQQELTGVLNSTGNLISLNQPSIVNVQELYIGKLIFQ